MDFCFNLVVDKIAISRLTAVPTDALFLIVRNKRTLIKKVLDNSFVIH